MKLRPFSSLPPARCASRACDAPLLYAYDYVVDDADAKGEFYNW